MVSILNLDGGKLLVFQMIGAEVKSASLTGVTLPQDKRCGSQQSVYVSRLLKAITAL